jgi:restriction system protein
MNDIPVAVRQRPAPLPPPSPELERLRTLKWRQCQPLVRQIFEHDGFQVTTVRNDKAVDLKLRDASHTVAVSCRHWGVWTVDTAPVREFAEGLGGGADKAMFITCGRFTEDARAYAIQHHVVLVDGDALESRLGHSS